MSEGEKNNLASSTKILLTMREIMLKDESGEIYKWRDSVKQSINAKGFWCKVLEQAFGNGCCSGVEMVIMNTNEYETAVMKLTYEELKKRV